MKIQEKILKLYSVVDYKFQKQFSFKFKEVSLSKLTTYFHEPKDSYSLAITRILFGFLMLWDIPDERGGAVMDKRWGDPRTCHFPLLPFMQPLPMPYMAAVYGTLWIGALGIMLGYKYRLSAAMFSISHWYLLLVDKSFWNNHSYLFGLVGVLLAFTQAHCYWSIDAHLNPSLRSKTVPYWNYFILKYQFFILYFMAGVKKGSAEWLSGYSVPNLSKHWVFNPFKLFLSVSQTDFLVVHCFVFLFDLTVAMWMMYKPTRNCAMFFCALFHLMNSRLFAIGMFPWVCLATMPLFYPFDWPKTMWTFKTTSADNAKSKCSKQAEKETEFKDAFDSNDGSDHTDNRNQENESPYNSNGHIDEHVKSDDENQTEITPKCNDNDVKEKQILPKANRNSSKMTTVLILLYVLLQAFLPFSHFITKGYNNWTQGLYGYSWDMMVHTWDSHSVVVKLVDNDNQRELFVDPSVFALNDRWTRHGDMVYQYAHCLKARLTEESSEWSETSTLSNNISIYVDIWYSLNGRFVQRMFDPKADILKANWSSFSPIPYLVPLLDDAHDWRGEINKIREEVHSWNNISDVIFLADLPGYEMEKFIAADLENVTLTVLQGTLSYEPDAPNEDLGYSEKLINGSQVKVDSDRFHTLLNIGDHPAFFMYTFSNCTEAGGKEDVKSPKEILPILQELKRRLKKMATFAYLLTTYMYQMFFRMPVWVN